MELIKTKKTVIEEKVNKSDYVIQLNSIYILRISLCKPINIHVKDVSLYLHKYQIEIRSHLDMYVGGSYVRVRETQISVFNFTRNSNKSDSIELLRALAGQAGQAGESAVLQ